LASLRRCVMGQGRATLRFEAFFIIRGRLVP
jgi:hypothetical protein